MEFKGVIKNITKNTWLKEESNGKIKHTKKKKEALLFNDEADAESTLEMLNEYFADLYTLIEL